MSNNSTVKKWTEDYIWRAYELAQTGMKISDIAKQLSISQSQFNRWRRQKPALQNAINNGKPKKEPIKFDVRKFVYGRLPADLKEYWDLLEEERKRTEKQAGREGRILKKIQGLPREAQQCLFIHTWYMNNFSMHKACEILNICSVIVDEWRKEDLYFKRLIDQTKTLRKDYVEDAAMQLVAEGNASAILQINSALNADRGYNPKVDVDVSGSLTHQHVVTMNELELSVECRRELLDAIRLKGTAQPALTDAKVVEAITD